jgi:hypothetical protein
MTTPPSTPALTVEELEDLERLNAERTPDALRYQQEITRLLPGGNDTSEYPVYNFIKFILIHKLYHHISAIRVIDY